MLPIAELPTSRRRCLTLALAQAGLFSLGGLPART
jgi:hypothetical protein